MNSQSIGNQIVGCVSASQIPNYGAWTIGLTHDPQRRKQEHESSGHDTRSWLQWLADSLAEAQNLEAFFIHTKGMKGGTGGNMSAYQAVYVYIF